MRLKAVFLQMKGKSRAAAFRPEPIAMGRDEAEASERTKAEEIPRSSESNGSVIHMDEGVMSVDGGCLHRVETNDRHRRIKLISDFVGKMVDENAIAERILRPMTPSSLRPMMIFFRTFTVIAYHGSALAAN